MKEFRRYLLKAHSPETVKIYLRDIRIYFNYMDQEKAVRATYQDIMLYIDYLRKQYPNPRTINRMLYGVKAWYQWLLQSGRRQDHPCRYLKLRDAKQQDVQLQDLFTSSELERLINRKERYHIMQIRNQVIISLLIYQALRLTEIERLRLQDIDLDAGTVCTRGMVKSLPRTLKLRSAQVMLFYRYIHEIRPRIIRQDTDRLILNIRGRAVKGEDINYLIGTFKNYFPDRKLNARTIRQSVITNLLKEGKDLRVVQVFTGHKNPGSTERYRQSGLEELKAAVLRHHPLK